MDKIWRFFENLNEYVYAVDVDSHQIVYLNKKTRESFGIHSLDDTAGKKCYEILQRNSAPCAFCNSDELKEGYFKEWEYYSPILNKYLALKDTIIMDGGKRYLLEMAVDVSAQKSQSDKLESYMNLEALANQGLRIALQAPTPSKSIDIILEYLGKALKGERTYIFEKNSSGRDDNTFEWVANGVTPEKDNLQNLPQEICANWYRNFREDRNIVIENLEDIRESDPLQYENLKRQSIHSLVVIPLYDDRKIIGFYGVDNPHGESLDYAQNMLKIMGYFIVSCLRRRDLLIELQNKSYCDHLTGLGNRFAMEKFVAEMNPEECVGAVYCDITGLKRVNDTEGHEAGDNLILRACECLKRVFGSYGLFRIGGDELFALCPKIDEETLNQKIEELKKDMVDNWVVMAVGAVWMKDGKAGLDRLLSESEKLMYEDKASYYKSIGVDRRR